MCLWGCILLGYRLISGRVWLVSRVVSMLDSGAEESVRMTEDRDKWRKYVLGVANPRIIEDG